MPANLPAEAKSKWRRVMEARTPEEKLEALQEFLSAVPKHKGTERLRMQVTRQIAALRREIELRRRKRTGGGEQFFVEKEGDIQVVLLGLPMSGKTSLFKCLTGVDPADTRKPVPGMKVWEGVYFQLVDAPPFLGDAATQARLTALARNADALMLVVDATADVEYQVTTLLNSLEDARITVKRPRAQVEIEKRATGGVVVVGDLEGATLQDVISLLREYGIYHAAVRIQGRATLDDVEEAVFGGLSYKPSVIVTTKTGTLGERAKSYLTAVGVPVFLFSKCEEFEFGGVAEYFFKELDLIRVYTRNPKTGEVEERPVVTKRGARVLDVAKMIHTQLYENFKYALVWSNRFTFNPRRVGKDFILEDGDIIQIVGG
ncbi:TGS domain-containing protein [Infirmifilum lucidum]|uniref:TGS domain-containing protein n=1 Tax=Infirmifilum lucidum TaxID=2776706 RepID=A0A7L9FIY7_9CREN|nr:TGS domain-containing protein [Infirmifilum lucidum]QOJ79687.1 TGS domain-containing protein [Infirmifilum lucidum]